MDNAWVESPITMNDAPDARLTTVPSTVAVPPAVKVCPGAIKNCVAAFPVNVDEPTVKTGGGACGVAAGPGAIIEVLPPTTIAVPPGTSETGNVPTVTGGAPGVRVCDPTTTTEEGRITTGVDAIVPIVRGVPSGPLGPCPGLLLACGWAPVAVAVVCATNGCTTALYDDVVVSKPLAVFMMNGKS